MKLFFSDWLIIFSCESGEGVKSLIVSKVHCEEKQLKRTKREVDNK